MGNLRRNIATGAVALTSVAGLGLAVAPAASAATGEQSFTITDRNPDRGRDARVVADGVINARGTAREGRGDRTVLDFRRGSLLVEHDANRIRERCNRRTGEGTITERGTYRITDGTRRYDNARGRGRYVAVSEVEDCNTRRAEVASFEVELDGFIRIPDRATPRV